MGGIAGIALGYVYGQISKGTCTSFIISASVLKDAASCSPSPCSRVSLDQRLDRRLMTAKSCLQNRFSGQVRVKTPKCWVQTPKLWVKAPAP